MTSDGWWSVVEHLRDDQHIIAERWQQVRREYHQLNSLCDELLHSLWILHALNFRLAKVLSHRSPPSEWVVAVDETSSIEFTDAAQVIPLNLHESYSRFLGNLRGNPAVIAEILQWASREGLDTNHLVYDLISVIYSHCLFQEDHLFLLDTLSHLLKDHVSQCSSYKELFGIEPVCSRLITEYCQQLPELKVFLSHVLREPLTRILQYNEGYLEYDVTKAGTRLQTEGEGFDVTQYVATSSRVLADICMQFLLELNKSLDLFPPSLKWLLHSLKQLIVQKWSSISPTALRRPVSSVLFGFIISSAFVNPDLLGVIDVRMIIDEVAWYNLSQVIGVLQGCAWIVDKLDSSDYPMRRVVSHMDMIPFNSLLDNIDSGVGTETPPVTSLLPGLHRSVYLFSKEQLENIVNVVHDACNSFMDLPNKLPIHIEISKAISVVPEAVIQKCLRNPYSFSLNKRASSQPLVDIDNGESMTISTKSPSNKSSKARSKSMWGSKAQAASIAKDLGKSHTLQPSTIPKSLSNPTDIISKNEHTLSSHGQSVLPQEVIILSLWKPSHTESSQTWDIQLMIEEEFIRERCPPNIVTTSHSNSILSKPLIIQENNSVVSLQVSGDHESGSEKHSHCSSDKQNSCRKSWSPESYNGSASGEEEELLSPSPLTKSYEPVTLTETVNREDVVLSSSVPATPKSKKSLRFWLSNRIRSKKLEKKRLEPHIDLEHIAHRDRVDSYTNRVGHITAKYEKMAREKRASEQPPALTSPIEEVRHDLVLPATIEEFITSVLYQQLKYKLSILLQNIHIPKPPLSDRKDIKTQLIDLLRQIQYEALWKDDYSESAVLSEVLTQLQRLDVTCIQMLLEGVKDNHRIHLDYLNYLSTCQKQCCDASLQINNLLNTFKRSRQLQQNAFLNFTMNLFFEERSAKLIQVKKDLQNCITADEKCALVQDCRDAFQAAINKNLSWQLWANGDFGQVYQMCDDHLFASLYQYIFHPNGDTDKQRDEVFSEYIQKIARTVTPQHKLLKIPQTYCISCPWSEVQQHFLAMSLYKSPLAKLDCIIKGCKLLIRLLQLAQCGDPPGADDIFPVLVLVLIMSNPTSLLSTEQYIKDFCEPYLNGETAYWWTQFSSAIGFLRTPEFTQQ